MVGSTPELGRWRVDRGLPLAQRPDGMWEADVTLPTHRKIRAKVCVGRARLPPHTAAAAT